MIEIIGTAVLIGATLFYAGIFSGLLKKHNENALLIATGNISAVASQTFTLQVLVPSTAGALGALAGHDTGKRIYDDIIVSDGQ